MVLDGGQQPVDADGHRELLHWLYNGLRDVIGHTYTAGRGDDPPKEEYMARLREWHDSLPYATATWLENQQAGILPAAA